MFFLSDRKDFTTLKNVRLPDHYQRLIEVDQKYVFLTAKSIKVKIFILKKKPRKWIPVEILKKRNLFIPTIQPVIDWCDWCDW